ncbi:hypothetical protein LTR56_021093 [Elasticomyces elasticus]|nr:hypothetical protein LTR56_021093 [Elasticomyces elasticus]KAK3631905.1 hypothetical protein LTR22_020838 [Elasticomyces elasticus]KAK4909728.1 hypothetical protein LTR49_021540 [Elasticomyces elasticus]KAK5739377.1 hypothetical protein LTR17_005282 [Elasticomyces elasticus]KAK5749567.1 hypothetical protein LTS12_020354 [Elasticomyces elasticus]
MKLTLISLVSMAAMLATALPAVDTISKTTKVSIADFGVNNATQTQKIHANIMTADTTTQSNSIPNYCFECGNGVDDQIAANVIDQFCGWFNGISMGVGVAGGYRQAEMTFDYFNNAFLAETGRVYTVVYALPDGGCEGPHSVSKDQCITNFNALVYTCDANQAMGRQGGYMDSDCLQYQFNPTPLGCHRS